MSDEERALMAAALTGSLTLMSILMASIGVLYGVYQKFCIPALPTLPDLPKNLKDPPNYDLQKLLPEENPDICRRIQITSWGVITALFVTAGTAFFAVVSLIGSFWWSVFLVKCLLFLEISVVPFIGLIVKRNLMPR